MISSTILAVIVAIATTMIAETIEINATNPVLVDTGIYKVLRAEIFQETVHLEVNSSSKSSSDASAVLTTQEDFDVVVQGNTNGALPVGCNGTFYTIFETYPAAVTLNCTDPAVNATLLQGEAWPEYGGFFLFVTLNDANPAAWMVGNHLSSSPGWSYEPENNDSWPPNGHWSWIGKEIIDGMPTVSLYQWLRGSNGHTNSTNIGA